MQAFNFPVDVSFSFGGSGSPRYLVNQIHYDNPDGVVGKAFYYTYVYIIQVIYRKMLICTLYFCITAPSMSYIIYIIHNNIFIMHMFVPTYYT